MSWWYVLEGVIVSWPPAAVALWFGRQKINRQTKEIKQITDQQTQQLTSGSQ